MLTVVPGAAVAKGAKQERIITINKLNLMEKIFRFHFLS